MVIISIVITIIAVGPWFFGPSLDAGVYRAGGWAFRSGANPYEDWFPVRESLDEDLRYLPFTYPPFAALVFVPLSLLGPITAGTFINLLSLIGLWVSVWLCLRHIGVNQPLIRAFPIVALAALSEPVRDTFSYGQINILLLAMVLIDVLVPHHRFRGILSGIATAIKLTPAVAIVYFLVRRDTRSALRMAGAAVAATGVAALIRPEVSKEYWLHTLVSTERIGAHAATTNQSLNGFLHRIGEPDYWFMLMAIALVFALIGAYQTRSDELMTISIVMLIACVCSPISWTHHWVWLLPLAIATSQMSRMWPLVIWCVATISLHRMLPQNEFMVPDWGLFGHITGNLYLWLALATILLAARGYLRIPHRSRGVGV